jgi:hypothetical protein
MQREEERMTEDREKTSGEDREQTAEDVEGHSLPGQQVGQTAGANVAHTDDDEPDVEGHSLPGQNVSQNAGANIA